MWKCTQNKWIGKNKGKFSVGREGVNVTIYKKKRISEGNTLYCSWTVNITAKKPSASMKFTQCNTINKNSVFPWLMQSKFITTKFHHDNDHSIIFSFVCLEMYRVTGCLNKSCYGVCVCKGGKCCNIWSNLNNSNWVGYKDE